MKIKLNWKSERLKMDVIRFKMAKPISNRYEPEKILAAVQRCCKRFRCSSSDGKNKLPSTPRTSIKVVHHYSYTYTPVEKRGGVLPLSSPFKRTGDERCLPPHSYCVRFLLVNYTFDIGRLQTTNIGWPIHWRRGAIKPWWMVLLLLHLTFPHK